MKPKKILISGGDGLVGSALARISKNYPQFKCEYTAGDLTDEENVASNLFEFGPYEYVIHAAAVVGGVGGNAANHGRYFYKNILMNSHMVHYAYKAGIKKFIGFSSVCAMYDGGGYLCERTMHDGPPTQFNYAYAYTKRMMDIQIQAYKDQYGLKNYCSVIPTNILGINDRYSVTHGHVVPSLIAKLFQAKNTLGGQFEVWGDGSAQREFIDSEDVARACFELLLLDELPDRLILSSGKNYKIAEVVQMLCRVAEYPYEAVVYDNSKPNGQLSRPSDITRFKQTLPKVYENLKPLEQSLTESYEWFATNYPNMRV